MSYVLSNNSWHKPSSCTPGCFHCSDPYVCDLLPDEVKRIALCAYKNAASIFLCRRYAVNTTLPLLKFFSYWVLVHRISGYIERRITQVVQLPDDPENPER